MLHHSYTGGEYNNSSEKCCKASFLKETNNMAAVSEGYATKIILLCWLLRINFLKGLL